MHQRVLNAHLNRNLNDTTSNRYNRCNGDVKLVDFKLQKFPWGVFVLLWSMCAIMAISIPYLAKSIPPTHRTDIKWWMSGVVYQLPPPLPEQRNYFRDFSSQLDDLRMIGVTAVRMSNFIQTSPDDGVKDYMTPNPAYGNMADFENLMDDLVKKDLRLIIDLPLAYTSTVHVWFHHDKHHQSRESVYVWQNTPEDDVQNTGKIHWHQDETRREYYQYLGNHHENAAINYATNAARRKIQTVFSYWLQRGVSGFMLLDYDTVVFQDSQFHQTNHIQFDDVRDIQLMNLANLTQTFKQYMTHFETNDVGDPDEPIDILLAVDLSYHDDSIWDTLYEAGIDMILNKELTMNKDHIINSHMDPFTLRQQVRETQRRIAGEYTTGWRICDGSKVMSSTDDDNKNNLINMVQLLLPGAAFLCHAQLPQKNTHHYAASMDHLQQLSQWRLAAAISWGQTQLSYVDRNTFSFVRYAFGKMFPRYIIIINFGNTPVQHNFTMIRDGITVPNLGTLHYFICPEDQMSLENKHIINSLVHLNNTYVNPRCGLLIQLMIKPPL